SDVDTAERIRCLRMRAPVAQSIVPAIRSVLQVSDGIAGRHRETMVTGDRAVRGQNNTVLSWNPKILVSPAESESGYRQTGDWLGLRRDPLAARLVRLEKL